MSFRAKLLICLLSLTVLSCGLLLWVSLHHANSVAFELIQDKVYTVAVSGAPAIDGDLVESLTDPAQDGSPDYVVIRDVLRNLRDQNAVGDLHLAFVYILRPLENGEWEYVADAEEDGDDKSYLGDQVEFEKESEKPSLDQPNVDDAFATDSFGTWLSAFAPIRNSAGDPVALLGVDVDAHNITGKLNHLKLGGFLAMILALAIATLISFWLSKRVTAPLRDLQEVVGRIGKGDLASRAVTESSDEFGTLGAAVNEMAEGLEERESLKGALVHYVRSQAADSKLWTTDYESDELPSQDPGQTDRRVTVMVTELKGFSALADRMGSERVFALLNDYFSTMIDLVLRHRGSLEKSSNDSVVAVFGSTAPDSHQVKNAVEAAIAMRHALEVIIHDWKLGADHPMQLQIGIHSGNVRVHTIGDRTELDGTSVAEIYGVADEIKRSQNEGGENNLILSSEAANPIRNVFPMEKLQGESSGFELFQLSMPGALS